MSKSSNKCNQQQVNRRGFLKASGTAAAAVGGVLAGCAGHQASPATPPVGEAEPTPAGTTETTAKKGITRFRTLGRTGFEVSDISLGCGRIAEANVVRYAYDQGINLFDVAESYGNGDSERRIGEAMPHLDRKKIFIVTKLQLEEKDTKQTVLDRFGKCLERMKTEYVDALYMHSIVDVKMIGHPGFHEAVTQLKADGKLKHAGISSHGPRDKDKDSMDKVLLAAAEDGRFDVMLLVYNYLNSEEGERVLKACKEKNIGTTAMKVKAGLLKMEPFDPQNPSEDFAHWLEIMIKRGMTREQAVEHIQKRLKSQEEKMAKDKPMVDAFMAKHGLKTQEELDREGVRFVLSNPDMHTICVSMPDFDALDKHLPLSGTELSAKSAALLNDVRLALSSRYCRHGCTACADRCPHDVPVSTVARYYYYFDRQGREKYAMQKYAALAGRDGHHCIDCDAPCITRCPHGVPVQAGLVHAHSKLSLA